MYVNQPHNNTVMVDDRLTAILRSCDLPTLPKRSIAIEVLATETLDGKVETKVFITQSMSLIKGVLFKVLDVKALALAFIVCGCQQIPPRWRLCNPAARKQAGRGATSAETRSWGRGSCTS